jgi:hypothetical protein
MAAFSQVAGLPLFGFGTKSILLFTGFVPLIKERIRLAFKIGPS